MEAWVLHAPEAPSKETRVTSQGLSPGAQTLCSPVKVPTCSWQVEEHQAKGECTHTQPASPALLSCRNTGAQAT